MTRELPAIEVEGSLSGRWVVTVLERLVCPHGRPKVFRVDQRPELASKVIDEWAHRRGVQLAFSRPGPRRITRVSGRSTPAPGKSACPSIGASRAWGPGRLLRRGGRSATRSDPTRRCTMRHRPSTNRLGCRTRGSNRQGRTCYRDQRMGAGQMSLPRCAMCYPSGTYSTAVTLWSTSKRLLQTLRVCI
jgi:hypothetical protein